MKKNETINSDGIIIVKKSVMQGDAQVDMRKPEDVCSALLEEVRISHPGKTCRLIVAKKLSSNKDGNIQEECVDGAGIGGCFACQFECK